MQTGVITKSCLRRLPIHVMLQVLTVLFCPPLYPREALPPRILFHTDATAPSDLPGVKPGDNLSRVAVTVKFVPEGGGPERILAQDMGTGLYSGPGSPPNGWCPYRTQFLHAAGSGLAVRVSDQQGPPDRPGGDVLGRGQGQRLESESRGFASAQQMARNPRSQERAADVPSGRQIYAGRRPWRDCAG